MTYYEGISMTIDKNSKVRLTELGKDVHDSGRLDGSNTHDILVYLNDNGTDRVFNIAEFVHMSEQGATRLCENMLRKGYIEVES